MAGRTLALAAAVAAAAAVLAAGFLLLHGGGRGVSTATTAGGASGGLVVAASIPSLADDVRLLLCPGDTVFSIVPAGVDPHSFQLSQRLLQRVEEADLVVLMGRAPFEVKLEKLVPRDRVLVVLGLEGLRIARNPVTGAPVYHMPVYEPRNYRVFVEALASRLEGLRPGCAGVYREKLRSIEERIAVLENASGLLSGVPAVGSTPVVVYPAEWLGLRLEALLVPEVGAGASEAMVERARSLLERGAVAVVLVDGMGRPATKADEKLLAMAGEAGAPVLRVPAPWTPGSTLEKMERLLSEARALAERLGGG